MAEGDSDRLPDLYNEVWKNWEFLEKTEEPTNSYEVQKHAISGLTSGEKAIKMINDLQLFSTNESIDEVSTNELRYMLLPAFMGYFTTKRVVKDRLELVKKGKAFFVDFLRQCKTYNVSKIDLHHEDAEEKSAPGSGPPDLRQMIGNREEKIRRFKEQKELESKLAEMKVSVEKEHVDDEVKREYYTTLLHKWVHIAKEEMDSLDCEVTMLELREQTLKDGDADKPKETKKKAAPLRPFIITKDIIQKHVYGAGYPSLPTLTIEEFYEQKVKDGTFQPPMSGHSMQDWASDPEKDRADREREEAEKEKKTEEDDEEELQKARQWDDWKDDHRKGWGNRKNMG